MRFFLLFAYITAFVWLFTAEAQQNINSLTTKDIKVNGNLEVNSTSLASKPCPVMTETQRNAIVSPQSGRCVYNSNTSQLNIFNGTIWKSAGGGISNWETAFNYALNDVVIESNKIYQCNTAHTSTVFASDIANWTLISDNLPIDLTTDVTDVLPMTNGGTDKNLTPTLGGVVYTDANSMEVLAAGTSGQVLKSNGAAAPTWQDASNKLQGQDQTEVNFTKLKVPKRSATPTATGEYLLEPNDNLLYNGGFEATPDLDGWTCVGAGSSFTIESKPVSASVVISGDKTLAIGCATVGGCTCTQDFSVNQQQAGRSVLLSGIVRSSSNTQGLKLTYRENGADTSITTENVLNGIPATEAVIGSSATTIGIKLTVPYSAAPLVVRVDEIKMAYGTAVTNQPVLEVQTSRRDFGSSATPVTVTGALNQTFGQGIYSYNSGTGVYTVLKDGIFNISASTVASVTQTNISINISGQTSARDSSNYDASTASWSGRLTSGQTFSVSLTGTGTSNSVTVSVAAFYTGVAPVYTGRCSNLKDCETVFTADINSGGVVSNETFDWINGNCTSMTGGTCTFNTGYFTVPPVCALAGIRVAGYVSVGIDSVSATGMTISGWKTSTETAVAQGARVICVKSGVDYRNAKTLQQNVALKSYSQTNLTTESMSEEATVLYNGGSSTTNCTGSCNLVKIGDAINSITRTAPATYLITLKRIYSTVICSSNTHSYGVGYGIGGMPVSCTNCSSLTFVTARQSSGTSAENDSMGVLNCKFAY